LTDNPRLLLSTERLSMFAQLLLWAVNPAPGNPTPNPNQGGDPGQMLYTFLPLILIFILGYFLMIRPMRKQEADRKAMASNLRKNDKVLTAAGIYGTVIQASDTEDEVVVKVDDNTRLRMLKSSVVRNMTREEEATQAAKEAKEQKQAK
jgi:preprotein translocase subunit YajC